MAVVATAGALALGLLVPGAALAVGVPVIEDEQPVIENESVTDVTATDATLNATIDTRGLYTAYEFEIDTSSGYEYGQMACPLPLPEYAQCMAIVAGPQPPVNEPRPEHIPAGSGVRSVSIDLAGVGTILQSGTTYHYRVIAANTSNGQIVYGPDQMFTTAASTSPEPPIEPIAATSTRQAISPPILAAPSAVASRGSTPHTRIVRRHVRRKREGHGKRAHRRSNRPDRTNVRGRTLGIQDLDRGLERIGMEARNDSESGRWTVSYV